ncbi:hypothetical protein CRG98_010492 [Punica granatum]|uniref:Uncharacterized protein n=1 Tax=Punica granatum TaxID=22663 RepID=A0A2I0KKV3_PUNGR|nr:hypothetical protein CRG98_010492 [Punica granatum]
MTKDSKMDLPLWMGSVVGIEREKAGGSVVLVVVDVLKDDEGLEDGFVVGIGREKAGGRLVLVVIDVLEDDKGLGDGFTVVDGLYRRDWKGEGGREPCSCRRFRPIELVSSYLDQFNIWSDSDNTEKKLCVLRMEVEAKEEKGEEYVNDGCWSWR